MDASKNPISGASYNRPSFNITRLNDPITPGSDNGSSIATISATSFRFYIIQELLETERKYVQALRDLCRVKKALEERDIISAAMINTIFLNIDSILDFQQEFLTWIEEIYLLPHSLQDWGLPFALYEERFSLYEPFVENQPKATATIRQEFVQIAQTGHAIAQDCDYFSASFTRPISRLLKYPLLLRVFSLCLVQVCLLTSCLGSSRKNGCKH